MPAIGSGPKLGSMKTVFRIVLALLLILFVFTAAAVFIVTRSGFQKWLVESRLPEGSRLESVEIGAGRASLTGLSLPLADGARVALGSAVLDYSLSAVLFSRTVRVGRLEIEGLRVEQGAPPATVPVPSPSPAPGREVGGGEAAGEAAALADDWLEPLYGLAEGVWRFEIAEVQAAGELALADGRVVSVRLAGGGLFPGETGRFELDSRFSGVSLEGVGPADFSAGAVIRLRQRTDGGFDRVEVEAHAAGRDGGGGVLLDLEKSFVLEIDPDANRAVFDFDYALDWPRPEVIDPALAALGAVTLRLSGAGGTEGSRLRVDSLLADGASGDLSVLQAQLLQPFEIGGVSGLRGEVLRLQLNGLPLSWIEPWLPGGMVLEGGPVQADFALLREDDGGLVLISREPFRLGPFSLADGGEPLVRGLTMACFPRLEFDPVGDVRVVVERLQVDGPTGPVLGGGGVAEYRRGPGLVAAEASLDGSLPALLGQPVLGMAGGPGSGRFSADFELNRSGPPSLRAVVELAGLGTDASGVAIPDTRLAVFLEDAGGGLWDVQSSLGTGGDDQVGGGTRLGAVGGIRLGDPLRFDLKVRGEEVRVTELASLADAFAGDEPAVARPAGEPAAPRRPAGGGAAPAVAATDGEAPWAGLEGTLSLQVDRFILPDDSEVTALRAAARVDRRQVALDRFSAALGGGQLDGKGSLSFDPGKALPCLLVLECDAESIDPARLSAAGSIPVRGRFDGVVRLEGAGLDPAAAFDAVEGTVSLRGNEGVVTAFELDERGALGIAGAGLLGVALNRPGLTELARVVPYFKEIRFSEFALDLERGADRRIDLSQLHVLGDNLLIEGSGSLLAERLSAAMNAPMSLSLSLASKGRMAESLEALGLLLPEAGEDGFRPWTRRLDIGGTLQDPDTSSIERLLAQAARSALQRPAPEPAAPPPAEGEAAPAGEAPSSTDSQTGLQPEEAEETKEERRARQIEEGLRALEGLF